MKLKSLMLLLSIPLIFIGCNNTKTTNIDNDDTLNIVTSFYPLYISTLNIVKDVPNVSLTNMTKSQTGCLHDYQLKPQDLKTLEKADILVVNGAGMESFLDDIIDQYPNLEIINASEGLSLLEDDSHNHDHDSDSNETDDHDDIEENDDHKYNPHIWVSVSGNIDQVKNISYQLENLDPNNKSKYETNTNTYVSKLEDLSDEMHVEIDNLPNRDIITFHEAFPYFAKEFNLNINGVIQIEPDSEPSAHQIEEIINEVKEHNITALFTEPQYASRVANTIANETGANIYELDPIVTGDSTPNAYDDYINKMKKNIDVLKEALK